METAAAAAGWVLFFHLPLVSGSSIRIGIGSNSSLYEQSILPCKKEELQCGTGLCLSNWLRCRYRKDCGRDYMSIQLTCSTPDGFSYGGSFGELRSTCMEEFPPAFDFGSYLDTLSQVNIMYPDSPPRYDECVGPGATQIYIPTDDPPPYSLTDPCQRNEISINISLEEEGEASGTAGQAACHATRLQGWQQPIPSISLSSLPTEAAPRYEAVVREHNIPIPLVPVEVLKNSPSDYQTVLSQIL
ncbi:UNVERIFIED_CONTAM: hypothetical protein H355_015556 [Colinus virginianus]|nr:hypothetical protein H355_015556 [Colinus virginianus]